MEYYTYFYYGMLIPMYSVFFVHYCPIQQSNAFILGFEVENSPNTDGNEQIRHGGNICWDPHAATTCAAAYRDSIQFIDTREMDVTMQKKAAHDGIIRDLDYNPNKPFTLLTTGDDRKIKFWDLRKPDKPLVVLCGHTHWVWTCRYNPYHDQLVLR